MNERGRTGVRMIGATDFKAHMSSYIEAMNETGDRIVLLRNNRPWALLSPPDDDSRYMISEEREG